MPQTQKAGNPHKKTRNKPKPSYYRTVPVGEDVVLETKLAKDGTLIVRLSMLEHRVEKIQVDGKPAQRGRTKPRPGKWIRMTDIRLDKLAEHLGDLEEQAKQVQLYVEADSLPLRHRPFEGLNLGAILIEGVEDAYNPPRPKPKPKSKPKSKRKPKSKQKRTRKKNVSARPKMSWEEKMLVRVGGLIHRVRAARKKVRALHTED